jgi:hypothetical protein
MFIERCKQVALTAQRCYPTGNKAIDERHVCFGFVTTPSPSHQQPEGRRSTSTDTATKLELEGMSPQDDAKCGDKEMKEWNAGKSLTNSGDTALWRPGASVLDSK